MDTESHVVTAIKAVGLDDTVWVPKIHESMKLDNIGLLKSVDRGRFESFLEQVKGSFRPALLEVYAQVSSFDPPNGSGEESFVVVSRSQVCGLIAEDSSVTGSVDDMLNSVNDMEKTLRVKEIFEEEKRNFVETDQAQRATHQTASNDHDLGERIEKDHSVNPSQGDVNQLEYDVEENKDEHSIQLPKNFREGNKDNPEKDALQQKDLVAGQTVEVTEDLRVVNKDEHEKDAQEQMDQNSEETPAGKEEVQDVNKVDLEKYAQEQIEQNSKETPTGSEEVQDVNKDDPEKYAQEQIEQNSKETPTGSEEVQDVNKDEHEKDAQKQMDQNSEETPAGKEVQDVNKVDLEKYAQEQIEQNSKETPSGSEEVQDVNKDDPEKYAQEQMDQNSEETPAGKEVQDVNKVDLENDAQEQMDQNSGQKTARNEEVCVRNSKLQIWSL